MIEATIVMHGQATDTPSTLAQYVRTQKGVLIAVSPRCRIPRTFRRFSGLMVQLLHKLSIHAAGSGGKDGKVAPEKLLRVIKNPVEQYLPTGCRKIGMSYSADKCIDAREIAESTPPGAPVVFVVGAMAHGAVEADYVDEWMAISKFPLSGSVACSKLTNAYEQLWGVL